MLVVNDQSTNKPITSGNKRLVNAKGQPVAMYSTQASRAGAQWIIMGFCAGRIEYVGTKVKLDDLHIQEMPIGAFGFKWVDDADVPARRHAYLALANKLFGVVEQWKAADVELAEARAGLSAEDRMNDATENQRIVDQRDAEVRRIINETI